MEFQLSCHYLDDGEMTHDKYKRETKYVFCKTWTYMGSLQTKLVREFPCLQSNRLLHADAVHLRDLVKF